MRMTSFKKIVGKLPSKTRVQFLKDMVFKNGQLVNVKVTGAGGALKGNEMLPLLMNLGTTTMGYMCSGTAGDCTLNSTHACDASACKGGAAFPVTTLRAMIEKAPPNVQSAYLDSLDFANGKLIRANNDLLDGHISPEKSKHLPRVKGK
jgi:hypothetical protein